MRFILGSVALMGALSGCVTSPDASQAVAPVAIVLQPDSEHGTCSIGYRVNEGGAVLRSGPSAAHSELATLPAGHVVSGCAEQTGWSGVIDGQDETCSVGIVLNKVQPYAGPCASGWIDQKSLTSIYG